MERFLGHGLGAVGALGRQAKRRPPARGVRSGPSEAEPPGHRHEAPAASHHRRSCRTRRVAVKRRRRRGSSAAARTVSCERRSHSRVEPCATRRAVGPGGATRLERLDSGPRAEARRQRTEAVARTCQARITSTRATSSSGRAPRRVRCAALTAFVAWSSTPRSSGAMSSVDRTGQLAQLGRPRRSGIAEQRAAELGCSEHRLRARQVDPLEERRPEMVHSAIAQLADMGDRRPQRVGREGHRDRVEVAVADHPPLERRPPAGCRPSPRARSRPRCAGSPTNSR